MDSSPESNSVTSTDFETAMTKTGCGWFNIGIILLAVPASCTSGFVTGTMSYVIPVASGDLGLTPITKALLQSSSYMGMITSAFLWGVLSDSLGRQKLLTIGFLLDATMNMLCALIPTLPTVIIFKFLSGFMVCGPYSIFMAYLSEVFADKSRGLAVLSAGIFSHTGSIIQSCAALVLIPAEMPSWLPLKSWQVFVLFCGLPAFLAGLGCAFTVESPKFLVEAGQTDKALEVCKTIYSINTGHERDVYPVRKIHRPKEVDAPKKTNVKEKVLGALAVLQKPYIYRILLVFLLQLCLASTMNMVRLWLPEMLTLMVSAESMATNETTLCPLLKLGHEFQATSSQVVTRTDIYLDMMALNACCLASHGVFMLLVRYLSKKTIIISFACLTGGCAVAIPMIPGHLVFIPAALVVALLNVCFYAAIGIVVEIFPTQVRATSVSLQMMVGRIGILAANFIFANLIYSHCEYVFYNLTFLCAIIMVSCFFLSTAPILAPTER